MPSQTDDQDTKKRFLRLGIGSLLFDSRIENMFLSAPPPPNSWEISNSRTQPPAEWIVRIRRWKSVRYIWSRACLICLITATRSIETGILSNYRTIRSFLKISVTFYPGGGGVTESRVFANLLQKQNIASTACLIKNKA